MVRSYSELFNVVVVTGPRQVGKTAMLKHLMEEDASASVERAYVTLGNTAILQTAKEDPALFLQRYRPTALINEIQKAPELLPYSTPDNARQFTSSATTTRRKSIC